MAAFKDLDELLEPWLDLPIRGKTYRIHSVDATTGLWCQRVVELAVRAKAGADISDDQLTGLQLDDDQEKDFQQKILGEAYDELLADKVSWAHLKHAALTAFTWTVRDRAAAEEFWARGGRPEAKRPAPQDRRPAKKTTTKKTPAKKASARKK